MFCNSSDRDEKKKYGKAQEDGNEISDWVFFHTSVGRQLKRNGKGEVIVSNTQPARMPTEGDRIIYIRMVGEKGPKALFWAFETDIYPMEPEPDEEPDGWTDVEDEVEYRVVFRTYHRQSDGSRELVHEVTIWSGTDVSTIPLEVWNPLGSNSMSAGDTEFVKVWQCRGGWVDCTGPYSD